MIFTRDSELVDEDWHIHRDDEEEGDANEHCILAVARVEMVCHYDNLTMLDGEVHLDGKPVVLLDLGTERRSRDQRCR